MKQTTLSQNGNSLLDYAISKLNPEVFSHPVWLRFGNQKTSHSLDFSADLLSAAQELEKNDPSAACQILLICAVYQNYAGQHFHALKSTRRAVTLAHQSGLIREMLWAMWGICAISVQQGDNRQATEGFVEIQAALSEQNEWILADLVDVLRQSFLQPEVVRMRKRSVDADNQSSADLLGVMSNWLQHWGFADENFEPNSQLIFEPQAHHAKRPFFSLHRLQGQWKSLVLAFRGELRLQWEEHRSDHTEKQYSLWGAFLSSLRLHFSRRDVELQNIEARVADPRPQQAGTPALPAPKEDTPAMPVDRPKRSVVRSEKARNSQRTAMVATSMAMSVHMLGTFSVRIGDLNVKTPSSRGLSVFKYLLLHRNQNISRDVLMDTFWPDAEPETARNNLNVAMHKLRQALRSTVFLPVIIFENGTYRLDSNLELWLDVEEFERRVQAGQRFESRNQLTAAVAEYEAAVSLYQGDLLEQNLYEEWTVLDRERLRIAYLDTLDRLSQIYFGQERYAACISVCQRILSRDRCREDAHCLLMRCYSRQGQHHLALRQYQICIEVLRAELDVEPAPDTKELYRLVRYREPI